MADVLITLSIPENIVQVYEELAKLSRHSRKAYMELILITKINSMSKDEIDKLLKK